MKRVLTVVLALMLVLCMMGGAVLPVAAASNVAGDVNGDGRTNSLDALVAVRVLSAQSYTGTLNARGLFVNGDAVADTADLVILLRHNSANYQVTLTAPAANETVGYEPLYQNYYLSNRALRILTQNIQHGDGSARVIDGVAVDSRVYRKERMKTLMGLYNPDVIGLQEYRNDEWFAAFEQNIFPSSSYGSYIVSRADPARDTVGEAKALTRANGGVLRPEDAYQPDERLAIFWKKDRIEVCTRANGTEIKGMYWNSETPNVNSPTFGTSLDDVYASDNGLYMIDPTLRITMWIKLRDKLTGKEFYYFNIHGPNAGDTVESTAESLVPTVQLLNNMVASARKYYGEAPVIVGGDFNMNYYKVCDKAAFDEMDKNFVELGEYMGNLQGTFPKWGNNIDTKGNVTARLDFFLDYQGQTLPVNYQVLEETFDLEGNILEGFGGYNANYKNNDIEDDKYNGYWASDHLGVFLDFIIK